MPTTFRSIFCPVDFSDCARHALDHAVALARTFGSRLTVLYAIQPIAYAAEPLLAAALVPTPEDRARVEEDLRALAAGAPGGVPISTVVVDGAVVPSVLEQAAVVQADLLVLGTHGRRGFERFLLGSTTERLLRRADVPVLTVPPRAPDAPSSGPEVFRQIVCAIDFSASSVAALQLGLDLARQMSAQLTMINVLEPMPIPDTLSMAGGGPMDFENAARAANEARLHQLAPRDLPVTEVVAIGKPYREVLNTAAGVRADLIVMGVQGGMAAMPGFLGSTTNHVVREAGCPVLSLRR
jgi:nucleotide-binding universal stress UspA family protein